MKKLLLLSAIAMMIAGCGIDRNKSLEIVKLTFPNSKVYKFPDMPFTFIVVDSSGIKKVTCLNLTDNEIDGVFMAIEQ